MEVRVKELLIELRSISDPEIKHKKQFKFGISSENSWGVYQKDIKKMAKKIGKDTDLGIALFDTGWYDARLLTAELCKPKELSEGLLEKWVSHFDTWEICDSFCMKLFKHHELALKKAFEWAGRDQEYQKRAGFVLMATYGFANKEAPNSVFETFFPVLESHANDPRAYVKKAVNWALRQIGKRNVDLKNMAIECAGRILVLDSDSAKWIAKDALRELQSQKVNVLDYPRSIYRKE